MSFHIHELLKVWSKNDKIILMLRCHIKILVQNILIRIWTLPDRLKKRIVVPNLDEPDNSPYGTPATYVNLVSDHMTNSFDFSMVNNVLCQFKHFKTVIGMWNKQYKVTFQVAFTILR